MGIYLGIFPGLAKNLHCYASLLSIHLTSSRKVHEQVWILILASAFEFTCHNLTSRPEKNSTTLQASKGGHRGDETVMQSYSDHSFNFGQRLWFVQHLNFFFLATWCQESMRKSRWWTSHQQTILIFLQPVLRSWIKLSIATVLFYGQGTEDLKATILLLGYVLQHAVLH